MRSEEEIKKLSEEASYLYKLHQSSGKVGKILNLDSSYVCYLLKRNGDKPLGARRDYINESYFENINTPEKAYILGFITADGSIYPERRGLKIEINEKDKALLEFVKNQVNSTFEIKYHICKPEYKIQRDTSVELRLYSTKLINDLAKYGVVPNKSNTPHQMPTSLISYPNAYIRGYFDGNGCVSLQKDKRGNRIPYLRVSFVGNLHQINSIKDYLTSTDILGGKTMVKKEGNRWGKFEINRAKSVKDFYDLIYQDPGFYLERKRAVFDNYYLSKAA